MLALDGDIRAKSLPPPPTCLIQHKRFLLIRMQVSSPPLVDTTLTFASAAKDSFPCLVFFIAYAMHRNQTLGQVQRNGVLSRIAVVHSTLTPPPGSQICSCAQPALSFSQMCLAPGISFKETPAISAAPWRIRRLGKNPMRVGTSRHFSVPTRALGPSLYHWQSASAANFCFEPGVLVRLVAANFSFF